MKPGKQRLGLLQSVDLAHYNLRSALLRNDFMGMMASIECRFPYLDHHLVYAALNLPYRDKIRFSPMRWDPAHPLFCDKWILRKVGEGASHDQLLEAYPQLTNEDIQAAITYAADTLAHEETVLVEPKE